MEKTIHDYVSVGQKIYVIDNRSVMEMTIIKTKNGIEAYAKDGYFTVQFPLSVENFVHDQHKKKHVFTSRDEAQVCLDEMIAGYVAQIQKMSLKDIGRSYLNNWFDGGYCSQQEDQAVIEVVKNLTGYDHHRNN